MDGGGRGDAVVRGRGARYVWWLRNNSRACLVCLARRLGPHALPLLAPSSRSLFKGIPIIERPAYSVADDAHPAVAGVPDAASVPALLLAVREFAPMYLAAVNAIRREAPGSEEREEAKKKARSEARAGELAPRSSSKSVLQDAPAGGAACCQRRRWSGGSLLITYISPYVCVSPQVDELMGALSPEKLTDLIVVRPTAGRRLAPCYAAFPGVSRATAMPSG